MTATHSTDAGTGTTNDCRSFVGRLVPFRRAPFAGCVLVALLTVIALVQAVNIVLVLLSPPPEQLVYSAAEIGAALRDEATDKHVRRRHIAADAMREQSPVTRPVRDSLAVSIGVPPDDLIVELPETRPAGSDQKAWDGKKLLTMGDGEAMAAQAAEFDFGSSVFKGPFKVGLRQPDGGWQVVMPSDPLFRLWKQRALIWLASSILVALPCAYLLACYLAKPIRLFGAAAEELGRNPAAPPIPTNGPAEIAAAAHAFNAMQQRLNRYVDDRVMMMGAIAHDLRTPLMRLSFRLDGLPDDVSAKARGDIEEMKTMLAAVLSYVRSVQTQRPRQPHELRSLLLSIADDLTDLGHRVSVEDGPDIVVDGDGLGLKSLFFNVIENAVKYGHQARVGMALRPGEIVVVIEDEGPGLPEDELERVFEPFYRYETSRNRSTGGTGLGLATARSIAVAHGGSVRLENGSELGLRATIRLPAAPVRAR